MAYRRLPPRGAGGVEEGNSSFSEQGGAAYSLSSTSSRDLGDSGCLGGNGSLGACSRSGFIFAELEF